MKRALIVALVALSMVAVLAGPASAGTAPAVAAPDTAVAAVTAPPAPAPAPGTTDLTSIGTPDPIFLIGMKQGPCTITITCWPGQTITCGGQRSCIWKFQPGGYVMCDGWRVNCPGSDL